jgi:hypothetical protein
VESQVSEVLSANAVAGAAGVSDTYAYKAIDAGVISEPHYPADVIALRTYRALSGVVWTSSRPTSAAKDSPRKQRQPGPELWQMVAVHAARNAVTDPSTTPQTVLWVLQDSCHLVHTAAERAALELSVLEGRDAVRLAVGRWIKEDLPAVLGQIRSYRPRNAGAARRPRATRTPATSSS